MPKNSQGICYVFWTSGWDSTYMVIQLLREGYTVQPLYIYNPKRKSREYEIVALKKLSKLIPDRIRTGKLLPYKHFSYKEIIINPAIKKARKNICDQGWFVGTQYVYLASFAEQHHAEFPVIGLGIEKSPEGKTSGAGGSIRKFGKLDRNLQIDAAKSTDNINMLFENFWFPIINTTEQEMLTNIKKWGYNDIMQHIWFCHNPIKRQPCGFCSPCFQKMKSHMEFLLPTEAKTRYNKFYHLQSRFGKPVKKIAEFFYRLCHK